jgi:hypothetical protein
VEPLQTFEYGNLKVETFYIGTDKIPNKVYIDGKLVQEDKTFRPSPMHCIDSTECMVSLLGFITLRRDDVEDEFFESRDTDDLVNWAEDDEDVRMMIYDFDEKGEDYCIENEFDMDYCTRVEQYITNH